LTFRPGCVKGGEYEFDIGTAGSTTLVFQTVLPSLLLCSKPSRLVLRGGTHNPGGPPWHFLERVFLPALAAMGAKVAIRLERYGFAPSGGGQWTAEIQPSTLSPLKLHERGELQTRSVLAIVSGLPSSIAERELTTVHESLLWPASTYCSSTVDANGPGNIMMIGASFTHVSELATGFGQRGIPAEEVASTALHCWSQYEESGAPVGEHLADQLLLPVALARCGSFLTMKPTLHTTTNADTIAKFLSLRFHIERANEQTWSIHA
jgi:RNA 3'-terminal phosphate cyclase (ATP)